MDLKPLGNRNISNHSMTPWIGSRVETQIISPSKGMEATAHEAQYAELKQNDCNIFCYTDG
jgi:hypothetical protein